MTRMMTNKEKLSESVRVEQHNHRSYSATWQLNEAPALPKLVLRKARVVACIENIFITGRRCNDNAITVNTIIEHPPYNLSYRVFIQLGYWKDNDT